MTTTDTTTVTPTTDVTNSTAPTTEVKQEEQMIPYSRFKEVNEKLAEFKTIADEFNKMKSEAEVKKLKDKGDYEAALNKTKEEYEAKVKRYEVEKFEAVKSSILTKYQIDEDLAKFITGSNAEELEEAAKLLSSKIQKQKEEDKIKEVLPGGKKEEKKDGTIQNLDFSIFFKK